MNTASQTDGSIRLGILKINVFFRYHCDFLSFRIFDSLIVLLNNFNTTNLKFLSFLKTSLQMPSKPEVVLFFRPLKVLSYSLIVILSLSL